MSALAAPIIVTFHGIGPPPCDVPAAERPYWLPLPGFTALLDAVVAARNAGARLAITFDDGYRSDLLHAAPQLAARGLTATFFIVSGRLGAQHALGPADIAELWRLGHAVGSHGATHRDWRTLPGDALAAELAASRAALLALRHAPLAAAAPFGGWSHAVAQAVRRAGYTRLYTSDGGIAPGWSQVQPRTTLTQADGPDRIDALLRAAQRPAAMARSHLRLAARRLGWR